MSKEIQKHIQELFKIDQLLGSGAYGHVWKVIQKSTKKTYALKKVFDAFQNSVDAQRTYRQITILHELDNPNIIKLKGVIRADNDKDLYLLFQHMETDLHSLVGENILEMAHLLFVIYQIFKSLKYLHSAQLVHRDLKPSNILINSDCHIKLCDFGLVRSLTHQENTRLVLSEDVATRWYRSPEMLLGSQEYGWATDVWSIGCILAELIIGQPLLMGGSNIEQLQKILELTGIPKREDISSVKSPIGESLIEQFKILKKPFKQYFKGSRFESQTDLINLIKRMLEFNPNKRIKVDQVLAHDLFSDIRSQKEEMVCRKIIIPELDDNERLSLEEYRQSIYKDIQRRYPSYNLRQPKQEEKPVSILRYNRGHNSLMNRIASIDSFPRAKATNSLIRPNKNKNLLKSSLENQLKLNQHQSLHCNTVHNSNFYKTAISQHEDRAQHPYFHRKNHLVSIPNKDKNDNKESTDVSSVIQKSPFRKFKKSNDKQEKSIKMQKIEGLCKENNLSHQNFIIKKEKVVNFLSQQNSQSINPSSKQPLHNSSKPYLFDPTTIYSTSPPKQPKRKQKNFYKLQQVSNQNKITKKTFTRQRKQDLNGMVNESKTASSDFSTFKVCEKD